ncbi:MAG: carboxypeptidase regulatory-like domain-containing protein, partial [Candidatus Cloacimonetes bacterium]|nr:carboxypeptidase regulatory-like domain-containing protein [Candidatus Cloacimonadota bacterium]
MLKKRTLTKKIILILGISLFFSSMIFAGPNENAGIRFDLDAATYGNQNDTTMTAPSVGDYIRVDVYAINVHNLDTYEFEVIYNHNQLDYITATATNPITYEPNILTTNGGTALGWMIDTSTPGVLSIAYTLAGTDTLEAPEGEGLIADIVFQSLTINQGLLTFGDVHFHDSFGVIDIITDKGIAILFEYGNVDGTVTALDTGEPIEGAIVSIENTSDITVPDGTYLLEYIPVGIQDITCTAEGYFDTTDVLEVLEDQTVTIDFTLEPIPYGTLNGTVTDSNTNAPIEDALITAISQGRVEYTCSTNADGYYIIDSLLASELVGNYTVTCDAGNAYLFGEETDVEIVEGDTTTVNFVLEP